MVCRQVSPVQDVIYQMPITNGLQRGQRGVVAVVEEATDFLDPPRAYHLLHARINALIQQRTRTSQCETDYIIMGQLPLVNALLGGEGASGQFVDFQGADNPLAVGDGYARCSLGIYGTQALMHGFVADFGKLCLQRSADVLSFRRLGRGEVEAADDGSQVQARSPA